MALAGGPPALLAEVLTAARRALEIAPNHPEAAQLVCALAGAGK